MLFSFNQKILTANLSLREAGTLDLNMSDNQLTGSLPIQLRHMPILGSNLAYYTSSLTWHEHHGNVRSEKLIFCAIWA